MINVCWTGAAGLEFNYKGQTILVDPYYTRINLLNIISGKVEPNIELINKIKEEKNTTKAIIAGHTHFDHVMDIPSLATGSDCLVIGSNSLDNLMTLSNMKDRTIVCRGNETIQIGDEASVEMIPSVHGLVVFGKVPFQGEISARAELPMTAGDYRVGSVFTPLIDILGTKFLHLGSAGFIESQLENRQCDVVFLCVPGWKKIKNYPERILELVKPEVVVLFHFDAFYKVYKKKTQKLMFLGMNDLIKKIKKISPMVKVIIPELFETIEF